MTSQGQPTVYPSQANFHTCLGDKLHLPDMVLHQSIFAEKSTRVNYSKKAIIVLMKEKKEAWCTLLL